MVQGNWISTINNSNNSYHRKGFQWPYCPGYTPESLGGESTFSDLVAMGIIWGTFRNADVWSLPQRLWFYWSRCNGDIRIFFKAPMWFCCTTRLENDCFTHSITSLKEVCLQTHLASPAREEAPPGSWRLIFRGRTWYAFFCLVRSCPSSWYRDFSPLKFF